MCTTVQLRTRRRCTDIGEMKRAPALLSWRAGRGSSPAEVPASPGLEKQATECRLFIH